MVREIGNVFTWVSIVLLAFGYIWSMILAWRANKGLFIVVFLFWLIGYPILLIKYWQQSKKSLFVFLAGLVSFVVAFALLTATNPNRSQSSLFGSTRENYAQQRAPSDAHVVAAFGAAERRR